MPQACGVDAGAGWWHHVSHELITAGGVLARHHGGLRDGGMLAQRGLDLAGFDAKPADLHLLVGPAEELQHAVGAPSRPVAGAVHPLPRRAIRTGDEPLGRQPGASQVAARQPGPGDVELAADACWNWLQFVIQHIDARIPYWPANRRAVLVAFSENAVAAGFGRAVEIDHPRGGKRLAAGRSATPTAARRW